MKNEPRISFYKNEQNKGILYTKTKGVLLAKSKYVMILDDDDKYLQRDAFTTLYLEAEKSDLDIIGFRTILSFDKNQFNNTKKFDSSIIYQNQLSYLIKYPEFVDFEEKNVNIKLNHLIKTNLFVKIIKQIDDKYLNEKINYFDDYLLFFLLTRNANSFRQINRIFYIKEKITFTDDPKNNHRKREKLKGGFNLSCFSFLNIIEILFDKTKNSIEDKKIALNLLEKLYFNHQCKSNIKYRDKALNICDLFIKSEYISILNKEKIKKYMKALQWTK